MLKRVFSYMKEYKKYAWSGLLCIGVEVVLEITVPLLMADLIDYGVTNADGTYIIKKGLQMALCAVLALILGVGSAKFSALAGQGLGANIRKAEYEKLQSYSFSNIDHFSVSSLVTRLTSDVTNIQNAVSTGMRPFGRSPVMLISCGTADVISDFNSYHYQCLAALRAHAECNRPGKPVHSGKSYGDPCCEILCQRRLRSGKIRCRQ